MENKLLDALISDQKALLIFINQLHIGGKKAFQQQERLEKMA